MRQILKIIKDWGIKRIIGLDIDDASCIATELVANEKQIILAKSAGAPDLKELIIKYPLIKNSPVFINIPTQVVLFRSFHIAPAFIKTSKNVKKDILSFLARQDLPFKLEECFWEAFVTNTNLNFIAAKKEAVTRYISAAQDAGLRVTGVTASLVAMHNCLINSYPERLLERFAVLNIRNSSSELLFYEAKRLWLYPLGLGKRNLLEGAGNIENFSSEVERVCNSHYLQNPSSIKNSKNYFYIAGLEPSVELLSRLKSLLTDFEVMILEPLKNLKLLDKESGVNQQALSLSIGLGLTFLGGSAALKINLIKGKLKQTQQLEFLGILKKSSLYLFLVVVLSLLFWIGALIKDLKTQVSISKNTQFQISSLLPQVKALKDEREALGKLQGFLEGKMHQGSILLSALAGISESKPADISVDELDCQMKDLALEAFLSGSAPGYEQINDFLTELKKREGIKEVKVVASTFSTAQTEVKEIDFKLRFEVSR